jgi:hypothetical protein
MECSDCGILCLVGGHQYLGVTHCHHLQGDGLDSCVALKVSVSVKLGTNPSALQMEAACPFMTLVSTWFQNT